MDKKKTALIIAIGALTASAIMDMILWLETGFMVPSFVISGMSIGAALLVMAIMKLLDSIKTYDEALDHLVKTLIDYMEEKEDENMKICVDEEKLDALLTSLEKATLEPIQPNKRTVMIHFCVDCMKQIDWPKEYKDHEGHTIIFTDIAHDGIGEWIKALKWIKKQWGKEHEKMPTG
jgi:hypothetical protein